jgi:hypothetical protein
MKNSMPLQSEKRQYGRYKKARQPVESLFSRAMSMLVPPPRYWKILRCGREQRTLGDEMREKEGSVPEELSSYSDVVFDGYCNPIETLSQ